MEITKLAIDSAVITLLASGMYVTGTAHKLMESKRSKAGNLFVFSTYMIFLWIYLYATIGIDLANVIAKS